MELERTVPMHRIIFDTDLGIDDALALLYLLRSGEAQIEAITTVHGNVPVDVATANAFEILSVAGIDEPPEIAGGSATPLAGSCQNSGTQVHGKDGLGGWTTRGRVSLGRLSDWPASELIPRLARRNPREVTLLLLGPATNAALALRRDPVGFRVLRNIVMMGGAVSEPGNITATAEFNVYADPEAAREVIDCGVPVTMVGLDVTERASITRKFLDHRLRARDDPWARLVRCLVEQGFSFYQNSRGWDGMFLHDPLAAAVALDKSLVQVRPMRVDIEVNGELTRGMVVAERRPGVKGGENTEVCVDVDVARFLELFTERVLFAD